VFVIKSASSSIRLDLPSLGRPATHTPLVAGCTGYDTGVADSHTPGCRPPSAGRAQLGGGIGAAPTNTITHMWDRNNGP
jgi:hypothetical protein